MLTLPCTVSTVIHNIGNTTVALMTGAEATGQGRPPAQVTVSNLPVELASQFAPGDAVMLTIAQVPIGG